MVYGYIRVSSEVQTVENQRFTIQQYCDKNGIKINGWMEETISGAKTYKKRKLGYILSRKMKPGDTLVITELSRLGRNLMMVMEILNYCMDHKYKLISCKDGYRLSDDIQSKVLAFAFGLCSELERTLIQQRTKEALARKKAEGIKLGRPMGGENHKEKFKLYPKEQYIRNAIKRGLSLRTIAKRCKCSRNTLTAYIERFMPDVLDDID